MMNMLHKAKDGIPSSRQGDGEQAVGVGPLQSPVEAVACKSWRSREFRHL